MTPLKIVALVSGIALLAFVGGLFGPGPLVPGLGPGFDQLGVVIALVVFASAGLWRCLRLGSQIAEAIRDPPTVRLRRFCGNE
jgi:hypothetical protein